VKEAAMSVSFEYIGSISTPFKGVEGMPIQTAGAEGAVGKATIEPAYASGLKDLEGFSHIILIYHLDRIEGYALEVVPFLDDRKHGIFATRSPKRPNPIGISVVRLLSVAGNVVSFAGPDMLDGTPLLDIKPYVSCFDSFSPEREGWFEGKAEKAATTKSDGRFK
jgi:tRNA-Thr(GGU) m(6)t(6)A37 methyltransferase TsaA